MHFDAVSKMIHDAITDGIFPSAAFAVGVGDTLLIKEACGRKCIEPNDAYNNESLADTETLYDIASLTKVIVTTMLAVTAMEKGKISLHQPISRYIGNVPGDKAAVTPLHLLTHTSGMSAHVKFSERLNPGDDHIRFILDYPLAKPVCEDTIYSCLGFIVLGSIIEKVMSDRLDILAEKYVFSKLGMCDTCFNPTSGNIAATEYDTETQQYICGRVHDENAWFLGGISGNAGVFSNITDMAKFAAMLSGKGTANGRTFFSRSGFEELTRNYTAGKSEARGLGFSIYDGRPYPTGDLFSLGSFGHTGFTGTSLFVDKESGLYVVLLTNRINLGRDNTKIFDFRKRFHNLIMSVFQNDIRK